MNHSDKVSVLQREIEDLKTQLQKEKHENALHKKVFQNIDQQVLLINDKFQVVYANNRMIPARDKTEKILLKEVLKCTTKEFLTANCTGDEYSCKEYKLRYIINKTFETKVGVQHQNIHQDTTQNKTALLLPIELSTKYVLHNNQAHVVVAITHRTEVNKLEEKFENMFNCAPLQIWAYDGQKHSYVNQAYFDFTGLNNHDDLGHETWASFVHPDDLKKVIKIWLAAYKQQKEHDSYFRMRNKDGEYHHFWCHAIPIFDNQHNLQHFLAYNVDITDKHNIEMALRASEQKLKKANETKDRFMSIIAHDLRGAFNVILGFTDILLKNHHRYNPEKLEKILNLMYQSSTNAYNLLENLLQWAKNQKDEIVLQPKMLQLQNVLQNLHSQMKQIAQKKNIKLTFEADKNAQVLADLHILLTILRNLISNAIKFTPQEGKIHVSARKNKTSFEISVTDTGVGIHPDKLKTLFNFNTKNSTLGTNDEKGSGLGLILCKEFVEKHNGKLIVKSEEEKGSSFCIIIPQDN